MEFEYNSHSVVLRHSGGLSGDDKSGFVCTHTRDWQQIRRMDIESDITSEKVMAAMTNAIKSHI